MTNAAPRILSVVDTREYIEQGDRWVPIPGSGQTRECDRCGRDHEVHATVSYSDGTTAVVGTGCMGHSAEVGRKVAASASTVARIKAEIARETALIPALEAAIAWGKTLTPPAAEVVERAPYGRTMQVGDQFISLQFVSSARDESNVADDCARMWVDERVNERAGCRASWRLHYCRDAIKTLSKRLAKAERHLAGIS